MTAKSNPGRDDNAAASPSDSEAIHDPYVVLGVARDASYDLIRRVYREKAKFCHPDLGSEPGREEEFKLLNWAHRMVGEQFRASRRSNFDYTTLSETATTASSVVPERSPILELLEEGRDRLHHGAAVEAERLARVALQRSRAETGSYILLAESLVAQTRFAEATGCLLMALQLDRNCSEARAALTKLQGRSETG